MGVPHQRPCGTTGGQQALDDSAITRARTGGCPADLLEVLRIPPEPVVGGGLGWQWSGRGQQPLLLPEGEQMWQPRSSFGPASSGRLWESMEIPCDERGIDVGNCMALLGQPLPELMAGPERAADAVLRISVLVECGRERFQVRPQGLVPQPGDDRRLRKAVFEHELLLLQ